MTPDQSHPAPGSASGKKHPPAPPGTSRRGVSRNPQEERPGAGGPARPSDASPGGGSTAGDGGGVRAPLTPPPGPLPSPAGRERGGGGGGAAGGGVRPPTGPLRPRRRGKGWDFGFRRGGDLNRQGALFLFSLLVIGCLLISLYLGLVSYTTIRARHIQDLRETLLQIQADNALLEQQIGEKQRGLFQQAIQMGFVPASQVEIVGP